MIFKSNEIPKNYNKVVEFSDNYIVFSKEFILNSNTNYDVYVQYFKPYFYVMHLENFRISKGDSVNVEYNYNNNGLTSYLESADISYTLHTSTSTFSGDLKNTADYIEIFFGGVLGIAIFIWCFCQLSRIFFKGGLH